MEALWREAVSLWTDGLMHVLPVLIGNPQLRPLAQAGVTTLSAALDVVRNTFFLATNVIVRLANSSAVND